jgi:hypothetical protein
LAGFTLRKIKPGKMPNLRLLWAGNVGGCEQVATVALYAHLSRDEAGLVVEFNGDITDRYLITYKDLLSCLIAGKRSMKPEKIN